MTRPGRVDLTGLERRLVALSAALATRSESRIREALEASTADDPVLVEEVLLQSYLFLGYPAALNGLAAWRAVSGVRAPPAQPDDPSLWAERGADVCRTVYAGQYPRLRANVRRLHPDMERWMIVEGYGKVLGRPGLPLALRELCIVAILAVIDAPRQLYSHLRGALHAGADPAQVEAALEVVRDVAPGSAARVAGEVWSQVRERQGSR